MNAKKIGIYSVLALLCASAQAALITYDFESLNTGGIVGQDNWVNSGNVAIGTGVNTSQILVSGGTYAQRTDDANFDMEYDNTDTAAILQFDVLCNTTTLNRTARLSVGGGGSNSPTFGFNGGEFEYREANGGDTTKVALSGDDAASDWYSLQLVMDFSGETASLYYKNLTDGDTAFAAVTGMQDLNLIKAATTIDPSGWEKITVRTDGSVTDRMVDNLTFNAVAVPEPATLGLVGLAFGGLVMMRRRRK